MNQGHMGHRIELGEIEAAMDKVPEIVRSCCIFDTVKSKIVAFPRNEQLVVFVA